MTLLFRKLNICIYNFSNKDVVVLSVKPTAVLFVTNIGSNPGQEKKLLFLPQEVLLPLALEHDFSKLQSLSLWTLRKYEGGELTLDLCSHFSYNISKNRKGFWNNS